MTTAKDMEFLVFQRKHWRIVIMDMNHLIKKKELVIIVFGGCPPDGIKTPMPGAYHRAG